MMRLVVEWLLFVFGYVSVAFATASLSFYGFDPSCGVPYGGAISQLAKAAVRADEVSLIESYRPGPFVCDFVVTNYDTSESKLRREFESYGPIKKIRVVNDETKGFKPRGYAFIEYERERDMHNAYKNADGKKIDGRRVLVDVERGRTVKGWRPRRLGGGLGGTRRGGPEENVKFSGRDDNNSRRAGGDDDRRRGGDEEGSRRRRSKSREKRSRSRDKRRRSRDRKDDRKEKDGAEVEEINGIEDEEIVEKTEKSERKHKRSKRSRSKDRSRRSRSRDRRDKGRRGDRDRGAKEEPQAETPQGEFSQQEMEVHDYGHGTLKSDYTDVVDENDGGENGYQEGNFTEY